MEGACKLHFLYLNLGLLYSRAEACTTKYLEWLSEPFCLSLGRAPFVRACRGPLILLRVPISTVDLGTGGSL